MRPRCLEHELVDELVLRHGAVVLARLDADGFRVLPDLDVDAPPMTNFSLVMSAK